MIACFGLNLEKTEIIFTTFELKSGMEKAYD